MSADILLSRLDKARNLGAGRWMAKCPSHEDGTASLSIRDEDGKVLLHCFAGCTFDEIIGAAGIDASDLFPPRPHDAEYKPPVRKLIDAEAALKALEAELFIAAIAVSDVRKGIALSDVDHERFLVAVNRILAAIELAKGRTLSEYERKKLFDDQLTPDEISDIHQEEQQEKVSA